MPIFLVGDAPFPWNLRWKWPTPFRAQRFRPISAHSASTVIASKKIQLALIGSQPRAFQRAIDEPCTLPLNPLKGGTKRDIEKSLLQLFLCVKTSSGKVVATSFPYPTVHRSIAGDIPIYLWFASLSIHTGQSCVAAPNGTATHFL